MLGAMPQLNSPPLLRIVSEASGVNMCGTFKLSIGARVQSKSSAGIVSLFVTTMWCPFCRVHIFPLLSVCFPCDMRMKLPALPHLGKASSSRCSMVELFQIRFHYVSYLGGKTCRVRMPSQQALVFQSFPEFCRFISVL